MTSFTDYKGTQWRVLLTAGALDDVQAETDINLMLLEKGEAKEVERLFGDRGKVVEVLWVLLREQAKVEGVDEVAFAHRFDRNTLDEAGRALSEEIVDFFYPPQTAAAFKGKLVE